MKTVAKKTALLQATLLLCGFAVPALAQTPTVVPPAAEPTVVPAPAPVADVQPVVTPSAPAGTMPAPSPVVPQPMAVPTTAAAPVVAPAMPSPTPAAVTTPPANMPTGTPAVVTQVMDHLKTSQENVSVEDLSKAQDALARLDLLLQIEKKIGEIKKTQDDRDSAGPGAMNMGGGGMVGQIPASALVLPNQAGGGMNGMSGGMSPSPMPSPIPSSPPPSSGGSYEIEQISGTNGNYNAILTTPDGDRKTVRAGDKLDGRTVQSISLDGVQLSAAKGSKKGGKTLTIHNDGVLLTPSVR